MNDLFDLSSKTALITGSSSGMGKAIALAMAQQGANVIISSFDEKELQKTQLEFSEKGLKAIAIPCDMNRSEDMDRLVKESFKVFQKIDILVNCVGIAPAGSFLDIDNELFEKTMGLNLQASIYLSKKLIPQMQVQKDGVIIYLASIAGVRGNSKIGLYGISKAGIIQLAKNLAVEFGPDNIRVNAISPGLIQTPFAASLIQNEAFMEKRLLQTPLRRVGEVHEIAGLAVLLASKAGAFITGQNIIVDGGTTISD